VAPLSGIRVIDLTRLLPGPFATRLLAELGAEVIKIEPPEGDSTRWMPPASGDPPIAALFREVNLGKASVVLDLKSKEGGEALRALIAGADVLVEGFRPGVMERLGFGPAGLRASHPLLVYCAITGFGQSGPDAGRAGHDIGYLARSGGLDLSGPAEGPVVPGFQVADVSAGYVAVSGILAALVQRAATGQGALVDVSLTESAMSFNALALGKLHAGEPPVRGEEILDGSRPCYGIYRTSDGRYLAVGALEPKFWQMFCAAVGLPDLADSGLDSGARGASVRAEVAARIAERTQAEWSAVFRTVDCCVEPIQTLAEAEADPHHQARALLYPGGTLRSPIRLSATSPSPALSPPPTLGADTVRVLRALPLSADTLAALTRGFS
jgi:crotonobetainyl-CoA:carnitine CoA-transferase CaiB-like acyl-CoA transferase